MAFFRKSSLALLMLAVFPLFLNCSNTVQKIPSSAISRSPLSISELPADILQFNKKFSSDKNEPEMNNPNNNNNNNNNAPDFLHRGALQPKDPLKDQLILISQMDGHILAVDPRTGEEKWDLYLGDDLFHARTFSQNDPPQDDSQNPSEIQLSIDQENQSDHLDGDENDIVVKIPSPIGGALQSIPEHAHPIFIPSGDGTGDVYVKTDDSHNVNRIPFDLFPRIVSASPFYLGDSVLFATKKNIILIIDQERGSILKTIEVGSRPTEPNGFDQSLNTISILLTTYEIASVNPLTGHEQWNISVSDLGIFPPVSRASLGDLPFYLEITFKGDIIYIDKTTGDAKWSTSSNSGVLSAFLTSGHTLLKPPPLDDETGGDNHAIAPFVYFAEGANGGHIAHQVQYHLPHPNTRMGRNSWWKFTEMTNNAALAVWDKDPDSLIGFYNVILNQEKNISSPMDTADQPSASWFSGTLFGVLITLLSILIVYLAFPHWLPFSKQPKKPLKKKPKQPQLPLPEINKTKALEVSNEILGYGSSGTIVYKGYLQGRTVAVKRLLKAFYKIAEREIQLLVQADDHQHVVRYYTKEEDDEFIYLALAYCPKTLMSIVESQTLDIGRSKEIIRQLCLGLNHLHNLNIVHRDLKPQNILIDEKEQVKISDMGLAKKLTANQSSFCDSGKVASVGWQPIEVILARGETEDVGELSKFLVEPQKFRITKKVDIFSLGCIIYYVLTKKHPFGGQLEREFNIAKEAINLEPLRNSPEALDLVKRTLALNPDHRPDISEVLSHPFWWDEARWLLFVKEASDRLDGEKPSADFIKMFETPALDIVGPDWSQHISSELMDNLGKRRKYNFGSIRDLLRLIRNKSQHWYDLPEDVQEILGPLPAPFFHYFSSRFKALFFYTYEFIREHCSKEPVFQQFYPLENQKKKAEEIVEESSSDNTSLSLETKAEGPLKSEESSKEIPLQEKGISLEETSNEEIPSKEISKKEIPPKEISKELSLKEISSLKDISSKGEELSLKTPNSSKERKKISPRAEPTKATSKEGKEISLRDLLQNSLKEGKKSSPAKSPLPKEGLRHN